MERNHSEHTQVRRPIIGRPVMGTRRIGLPMYWDPDPPAPQPPQTPPAPNPPAPPATPPSAPPAGGAPAADVEKMRRDNERMRKALEGLQEEKTKAAAAVEEKDREAAAKRGEWEKLYGEEKTKGKTMAEQLEGERKARGELEDFLRSRTKQALDAAPEDVRKSWKAALEAQPSAIAAQTTLDALIATMGASQQSPSPRPGAPGRNRSVIDLRELSKNTPSNRARLNELVLTELKGKG